MSATEFAQIVSEKFSIPLLTEVLVFSDLMIRKPNGFDSNGK